MERPLSVLAIAIMIASPVFAMRIELVKRYDDIDWQAKAENGRPIPGVITDFIPCVDGQIGLLGDAFLDREEYFIYERWWFGKTDPNLDTLLWSQIYGRNDRASWFGMNVTALPDSGFLLYGSVQVPPRYGGKWAALRIGSNGDSLWYGEYGRASEYFRISTVAVAPDGGFFLVSQDNDPSGEYQGLDYFQIFKIDSLGELLWHKDYGRIDNDGQILHSLGATYAQAMGDGGLFLAGGDNFGIDTVGNGGYLWTTKGFALRLDSNGDEVWFGNYRDTTQDDYQDPIWFPIAGFNAGVPVDSSSICLVGAIEYGWSPAHQNTGYEFWLVKMDLDGQIIWQQHYTDGYPFASLYTVLTAGPDSILAFGYFTREVYGPPRRYPFIALFNGQGELIDSITGEEDTLNLGGEFDYSYTIARELGHNQYLFRSGRNGPSGDFYKLYLNDDISVVAPLRPSSEFSLLPAFPNPFNSSVRISFAVPHPAPVSVALYDLSGRQVALLINDAQSAGFHTVTWPANDAPTGIYFVQMTAPTFSRTQRIVLMK